jgi:hypothetical protein
MRRSTIRVRIFVRSSVVAGVSNADATQSGFSRSWLR